MRVFCTLRICTVLVEAANRLGARPDRCVVIDDAEAGVAAGRAGGFGLVTGVARTGMFSGAVTLLA
jgi:beta-phosphoglucomutase-like phosphatase (HAD superfamily)